MFERYTLSQLLVLGGFDVLEMRLSILSIPRSVPEDFGDPILNRASWTCVRQQVIEVIIT
jgi:hypothetical protein